MDKKKLKINIILIVLVAFLVVIALMIRFEFNPISYLLGNEESSQTTETALINYNGIYRYKESLNKSYKLYRGCTLSYYDYYIVVVNNDYYRYKSSCVGTFFIDEGKTRNLKFSNTLEQNVIITLDGKEYLKTDYVNSLVEGNYFKKNIGDNNNLYADTYHILMKEVQLPGSEFDIGNLSLNFSNVIYTVSFDKLDDGRFQIKVLGFDDKVIYSYIANTLDELPLFWESGNNLTVIETTENNHRYAYKFKSFTINGLNYDLESKFPITVDGDELKYTDSIYIKYSPSDNAFIMLVGDNKKFCEKDSDSKDVAYYVFHIKYDYVLKNFNNPKFIKKVYKNEGCNYVESLMEG